MVIYICECNTQQIAKRNSRERKKNAHVLMVKLFNKTAFCIFITENKNPLGRFVGYLCEWEEIEKLSSIKIERARMLCVCNAHSNLTRRTYAALLCLVILGKIYSFQLIIFHLFNFFSRKRVHSVCECIRFICHCSTGRLFFFFCCSILVVQRSFRFVIRCVDPSANIIMLFNE